MVQIIAGEKGKGKTKQLLDQVNAAIETATGNIVYLDKSQKHMHELSNKVRLINVADYPLTDLDVISEKYNVAFVLSVSKNEAELPECAKGKLIVSL